MKRILVIALAVTTILSSALVSTKKAQAVEPGSIVSGVLIVSAIGVGIWTIYEIAVVGDELSASTSEFSGQVMNKREAVEKLQEDAFEVIAGEGASGVLAQVITEAREQMSADASAEISDEQIAKALIQNLEVK